MTTSRSRPEARPEGNTKTGFLVGLVVVLSALGFWTCSQRGPKPAEPAPAEPARIEATHAEPAPAEPTPAPPAQEWVFRWDVRTDRDGKPAGVYDVTPCPIDEHTTRYAITNDEGTKTYELGEKYFVDGARPDDGGDGRSPGTAKKTIAAAIQAAGAGNRTIVVRGGHDGFDGIYFESFGALPGGDDTHRWMVVGYRQERPVLDGRNGLTDMARSTGEPDAYVTIQRLKIQNSQRNGVRLGNYNKKLDRYFTMVDVWVYNCCNNNVEKCIADAGVYYMNSDYGYISHCVVERSKGHGFKIGDAASDVVIEWSVADGAGWYPDYDGSKSYMGHPTALDFPHDRNNGFRLTCRYCIATNSCFYGVQIRRIKDFSFHHNEIYNTLHFDDIRDCDSHSVGRHQVIIFAGHTSGNFYSNVIHDPGASGTNGIYVSAADENSPVINVYDNVIYGNHKQAIRCHVSNKSPVNVYGNRVHSYGPDASVCVYSAIGDRLSVRDNVFCFAEAGSCLDIGEGRHQGNRYWFPKGKRGVEPGEGESDGDPGWKPLPVGPATPAMFRLENTVLEGAK